MTINTLTTQLMQEIYEEAVSAECFERENVDSACFDLLCKMDEAGGLSHVVRKLIDMTRAKEVELQEYRKTQKPVMFIDGDISPTDAEKLAAAIRDFNSEPVELFTVESPALRDVAAERQRQQSTKGYSVEQDDTYIGGELAAAAISYIEPLEAENYWPADWHDDSFKPSGYRRNLVKAAALLLAEIERIDRQEQATHE